MASEWASTARREYAGADLQFITGKMYRTGSGIPRAEFDYNVLQHQLRDLAATNPGAQFIIEDLRKASPKRDEMLYERGKGHTT